MYRKVSDGEDGYKVGVVVVFVGNNCGFVMIFGISKEGGCVFSSQFPLCYTHARVDVFHS